MYPKECNFCKKYRIKRQQKIYLPITVCTEEAVNTIKQAAEANEDQTLFFEIKDLDLIAKEFKYHECCYKDFTRKEKHLTPSLYGKGNFEKVKACIEKKFSLRIRQYQCVFCMIYMGYQLMILDIIVN